MTEGRQRSAEARRIDRAAAGWLVKRDRGFTATEQDEFFQWLAADPRHGEWFARHQQTWTELNLLAEWRPEHSKEPNPRLLATLPRRRPMLIRWCWFGAVAAAACLAVAILRGPLWPGRSPESQFSRLAVSAQEYECRVLEDASILEFNRGSKAEITYSPNQRLVRLVQGEANFTVTKNPARPFVVRAGAVEVRAVGTAFNVSLDEQRVHVLVTEGRVRVDDTARNGSAGAIVAHQETPVLVAGQSYTVDRSRAAPATVATVSSAQQERELAWRIQQLEFDSTALGQVIEMFNRRNAVKLEVADVELLDVPIVASFRSDNVDGFVRLLELTAGVRAERNGSTIRLAKQR